MAGISKTKFKNYTKCDSYFYLEQNENEILKKYNQENKMSKEDLNDFMEVEELVWRFLKLTYKENIEMIKHHEVIVSDEDYFTELDYSYVDNKNNFNVFEVKATTDKKFTDLVMKKNADDGFFQKINGVMYYMGREEFYINDMCEKYFKSSLEKYEKKRATVEKKLFDRYSDIGKYIFDIAYQKKTLIDNEKYNIFSSINYNLVIINSKYVHNGNKEYTDDEILSLFTIINCNTLVEMYYPIIEELVKEYEKNKNNTIVDITYPINKQCKFKNPMYICPFSNHCKKKNDINIESSDTIFNLYRFPETKIFEHISEKKPTNIKDLQLSMFKEESVQYLQTKIIKKWYESEDEKNEENSFKNDYYDKNSIREIYNNSVVYPIYHLDFEAITHPIPKWEGEKSYMQSVFQYSMHIETNYEQDIEEIKVNHHYDYLANNSEDPRYNLYKDMVEKYDFSKPFTTMVYNESFEKTRLKEAIIMFRYKDPDLVKKLEIINDSVFDLMNLIKGSTPVYESNGVYPQEKILIYKKDFKGSYSIKKVLPSFVPSLSYGDLVIGNGTQAMSGYRTFETYENEGRIEELNELVENMKIYCGQDTFAMVLLLRKIINLIGS